MSTELQWREIAGFPGFSISSLGQVAETRVDGRSRILKLYPSSKGYLNTYVGRKPTARKMTQVHRMVAAAFVPNPSGKPCVNHKDGNKKNNAADNLEWVTHGENMAHAYKSGLIDVLGKTKLTHDDIIQVRALSLAGIARREIEKRFRVSKMTVQRIANGSRWSQITA